MTQIIIVDDEVEILAPLEQMLTQEGYHVSAFSSSLAAQAHLQQHSVDLAIFDIKMPEMDGFSLLKSVRAKMPNLPIIFLSSKAEEQDQIIGFTLGADDYITKPIKPKVLVSKIKSLLRRLNDASPTVNSEVIHIGELTIDREAYKIISKGIEIVLPRKEFELLSLLASKPGKVFKRDEILDKVWGNEVVVGGRTIDVHIRKLREKIGDDSFKTIKGVGYKFQS